MTSELTRERAGQPSNKCQTREKILFGLVWFLEKIKAPDKILFRLYNALWLGNTYRSFREAYKRLFSSEQRPLPPL